MSQQQLLQIVTFQKNLIPHVFFQHLKNSLSYAMATHNTILAICLEMQLFVMIASQNFYYLLLHRGMTDLSKISLAIKTLRTTIATLRATSCLLSELFNEGYKYLLTAPFQSDPLERQFSKYRQIGGVRFLVSLREVTNSEKQVVLLKKILIFGKRAFYIK